jgi:hypothetical protein
MAKPATVRATAIRKRRVLKSFCLRSSIGRSYTSETGETFTPIAKTKGGADGGEVLIPCKEKQHAGRTDRLQLAIWFYISEECANPGDFDPIAETNETIICDSESYP